MIIISTPKSGSSSLAYLLRSAGILDVSYRARKLFSPLRSAKRTSLVGRVHREFDEQLDFITAVTCNLSNKLVVKGHFCGLPSYGCYENLVFLYREPREIIDAWRRASVKEIHQISAEFFDNARLEYELSKFIDYWLPRSKIQLSFEELTTTSDWRVKLERGLKIRLPDADLPRRKYSR